MAVVTGVAACSSSSPSAQPKPVSPSTSASAAPSALKPSAAVVNGTIVFSRFADKAYTKSQIVVAHLDGTHQQVLTDPGAQGLDMGPVWSPDGKTIAFSRKLPKTTCEIKQGCFLEAVFTVSATGGPARQLTLSEPGVLCAVANVFNCEGSPHFSPDGKHIAYQREYASAAGGGRHANIWIANADGTQAHQVTTTAYPGQEFDPVWSPDGQTLAFVHNSALPDQTGSSIYTVGIDGTGMRQLTADNLRLTAPNWAPDGSKIVAVKVSDSDKFTPGSVYTVHPDGTGLSNITGAKSDLAYTYATYSPDSRYIIASRVQAGVNTNNAQLWLLTATGTPIRRVIPNPLWQGEPRWDPVTP
jgi:TolB protein